MIWVLVSNGNVVACFDDPIKAFEFTYSPDDKIRWERNTGLFRGHVNGKVKYWLSAAELNPKPILLSRDADAARGRFVEAMREGRTSSQDLMDRHVGGTSD